ncbi:MaoC family dehydratase [Denitratisoma sp. agr-D3]
MASQGHFLEDFTVGQTLTSGTISLSRQDIQDFARQFDPQVFHLDPVAAEQTLFGGLAASGWHTAALTMRLLVGCELQPVGGLIGAGVDELRWPLPVRPGDTLHLELEVLEVRASRSRPERGIVRVRMQTFNQHGQVVQSCIANVVAPSRKGQA